MFWVLLCATFSVLISLVSKKRLKESRTSEKTKAVLVNAVRINQANADDFEKEYPGFVKSCKTCGSYDILRIDLIDKYFQVKFGGSEREWDGVTLSAVLKGNGLKPNEFLAKVFLDEQKFLIEEGDKGETVILRSPGMKGSTLQYYAEVVRTKEELSKYGLSDYDLIFIRSKKDKSEENKSEEIGGLFVFLNVENDTDTKISKIKKIHIENFTNLTKGKDQNAG
jgi:hypothetical protein